MTIISIVYPVVVFAAVIMSLRQHALHSRNSGIIAWAGKISLGIEFWIHLITTALLITASILLATFYF